MASATQAATKREHGMSNLLPSLAKCFLTYYLTYSNPTDIISQQTSSAWQSGALYLIHVF